MNFARSFNYVRSRRFCSIKKAEIDSGSGIGWCIFGGIVFLPACIGIAELYSGFMEYRERRERDLHKYYFDEFYDLKKSEESKKVSTIAAKLVVGNGENDGFKRETPP